MAKADDSKGKTLTAAVKLFRQQGYHGTALHDILAAGGAPRGSLYFHFPKGKEEIGAGALLLAGEAVRQAIVQAAEKSDNAESFLVRIVRAMASDLERSDYREGCPIATTALETAAQSEVLGAATRTAFQKWELEIKRGLFLFGLIGFIVGPIVCGLFLTVWDIYGATFKEILPPVTSFRRSDQDASAIAPQESSDQ